MLSQNRTERKKGTDRMNQNTATGKHKAKTKTENGGRRESDKKKKKTYKSEQRGSVDAQRGKMGEGQTNPGKEEKQWEKGVKERS